MNNTDSQRNSSAFQPSDEGSSAVDDPRSNQNLREECENFKKIIGDLREINKDLEKKNEFLQKRNEDLMSFGSSKHFQLENEGNEIVLRTKSVLKDEEIQEFFVLPESKKERKPILFIVEEMEKLFFCGGCSKYVKYRSKNDLKISYLRGHVRNQMKEETGIRHNRCTMKRDICQKNIFVVKKLSDGVYSIQKGITVKSIELDEYLEQLPVPDGHQIEKSISGESSQNDQEGTSSNMVEAESDDYHIDNSLPADNKEDKEKSKKMSQLESVVTRIKSRPN
uniref:Zf-C2H2_12 domain-containing protein n=1 Tax=Caenorhabditis tropicalis TaxID=1561998 RepID=A0A1I7U7M7_9PELO